MPAAGRPRWFLTSILGENTRYLKADLLFLTSMSIVIPKAPKARRPMPMPLSTRALSRVPARPATLLSFLLLATACLGAPASAADAAAKPSSASSSRAAEEKAFVDALLERMTLEEKVGQMTSFSSGWSTTGPTMREGYRKDIREGRVGSVFNAITADFTRELQELAVEDTRLGIPLLFGYDVIHGHRTIFPI
ncbi:MAG TPA: glycoside hydrolase family 3 N-terminal domain-containing protein, partial [Woeseiaceae bacterium]